MYGLYNKVIMYDEDNMKYLTGSFTEQNITRECGSLKQYIEFGGFIENIERNNKIELDEDTMKRIAKYNKEAEIKQYDEIIKEKQERIKEIEKELEEKEEILKDKSKRVEKLKDFVAKLYDIEVYDEEDDY